MQNKKQWDMVFTKLHVKGKAIIKKGKLTVESIFSSISGVFFLSNYFIKLTIYTKSIALKTQNNALSDLCLI